VAGEMERGPKKAMARRELVLYHNKGLWSTSVAAVCSFFCAFSWNRSQQKRGLLHIAPLVGEWNLQDIFRCLWRIPFKLYVKFLFVPASKLIFHH
jgi:hypothetical protein